MKTILQRFFGLAVFGTLLLGSTSAWAQKTYGGAPQRGNGAYVLSNETDFCMPNSLLGVPALAATDCVNMTREKLVATPSGNAMIVWRGTVPDNARPAQRVVFNSTFTENSYQESLGRVYNTEAVTEPSGKITLTLRPQDKSNGKRK